MMMIFGDTYHARFFPDITYERYPKPAKNDIRLNKKRFYLHTRRIWLKNIMVVYFPFVARRYKKDESSIKRFWN